MCCAGCRCPFQVVLSRYCFPTTEQEYTLKMKLMDVIVRKERTWSCWQWLQQDDSPKASTAPGMTAA